MTDDQIRREIWHGKWAAYGHEPTDQDYAYWGPMWNALIARGVEINRPNYAMDRLIGWTSGEPIADADRATYGDYAVPPSPFHEVPPYPGDDVIVTPPPPIVTPPPSDALAQILAQLQRIEAKVDAVKFPNYETHLPIHAYVSSLDIVLKPKV